MQTTVTQKKNPNTLTSYNNINCDVLQQRLQVVSARLGS